MMPEGAYALSHEAGWGRGRIRRSSWPPTPLARPPSVLLEITDPFFEKEMEEEVETLILQGKAAVITQEGGSVGTVGSVATVVSAGTSRKQRIASIFQHYYPEGGWGLVLLCCVVLVQCMVHGLVLSYGVLVPRVGRRFRISLVETGWLGSLSPSVSLLISPVTIAFCRRKSTRLTAVMGGLVTALGCLFTSFAFQYHQLLLSYGIVLGIGVGLARDTSTLMVGQYFKRRREMVEILLVAASGLGIASMSYVLKVTLKEYGWRHGLQAVTVLISSTFILGMFYRSATLYHPQRRAILHLKNQKRKIKDKNKNQDDKPPFFDISCLKSRTIQILLVSTALGAFGLNTPLIYLAVQAEYEGMGDARRTLLQVYLGVAWATGSCVFGCLVVQRSGECRVGRQYLCQVSLLVCGLSLLALTTVQGFHGYVTFTWVYGLFMGGYHYSLKMYVYQKVRARNFARAWGYIQASQAVPSLVGPPLARHLSQWWGGKTGYYCSALSVLLAALTLFLINIHKNRLRRKQRHKRHRKDLDLSNGTTGPQLVDLPVSRNREREREVHERKLSLTYDEYFPQPAFLRSQNSLDDILDFKKPELTCISEEGIADMDLPDNLLEELEFMDNITSCNKVENYLMLSEYEQNLLKETEGPVGPVWAGRKGRRWSLVRQNNSSLGERRRSLGRGLDWPRRSLMPHPGGRSITTIDEASA